jgi:[ribosomal protein S18]-alanine N-acetyltransferase
MRTQLSSVGRRRTTPAARLLGTPRTKRLFLGALRVGLSIFLRLPRGFGALFRSLFSHPLLKLVFLLGDAAQHCRTGLLSSVRRRRTSGASLLVPAAAFVPENPKDRVAPVYTYRKFRPNVSFSNTVIRLRPFRNSDLNRLYELDQACFAHDIAYSRAELRYFLAKPACTCWVAEREGGSLAGFLILERVRSRGRPAGHIVTIDVAQSIRRHGVGQLLLQAAEAELQKEGVCLLLLEVAEDNAAARAFYHRFGFRETGWIPGYYAGRLNALVMERNL